MATAFETLELAAELVERGWRQGVDHESVGGVDHYCAFGAVREAERRLGVSAMGPAWRRAVAEGFRSLGDWNDYAGRTQAEAVKLLRDAALDVRR